MKKRIIIPLLILLIIALYLFYPRQPATEEQIVKDWVKKQPAVITEEGEQRAIAAEWIDGIRKYLLKSADGDIGYIEKDKLLTAIKTKTKPTTTKTSAPATAPPAPVPAPTPVTVPVPTPSPVITPQPVPTPTPTPPIPTPTPTPSPTPPNITTPMPEPTNITVPTPTPTSPSCGNQIIELGEQCEPPNTQTCDANCQLIIQPPKPSHCTNSEWDGDESDLDCGGSCNPCPSCPECLSCWTNLDCKTGNCDMSQAMPLPAINPKTQASYNSIQQLQILAGQTWIIPYQGRCV